MFDANMSDLPKGCEFFAKVHALEKRHPLLQFGVKNGDIVKCKMLTDSNINPTVQFRKIPPKNTKVIVNVSDEESGEGSLIAYEGNIDGTGFIDKYSKALAMDD